MRRLLCWLHGGHAFGWPRLQDGRMRQSCLYGCGAMTTGWEGPKEKAPEKVVEFSRPRVVKRKVA